MIKIFKKNKIIIFFQTAPKALSGKSGYAVLELLFYISFFAVFSLLVINAMIAMARSFKETTIQAELVQSGNIMERMSREIRQSSSESVVSATDLKLDTNRIEFKLSGSDLQFFENDIFIGNLNTPNIVVSALSFTQITTAKGKAVKIVLTLKSNNDTSGNTQNFYDTIVLRGDY